LQIRLPEAGTVRPTWGVVRRERVPRVATATTTRPGDTSTGENQVSPIPECTQPLRSTSASPVDTRTSGIRSDSTAQPLLQAPGSIRLWGRGATCHPAPD